MWHMAHIENEGQRERHCFTVPIMVVLAMRIDPRLLFIIPDFRAHFAGILFQLRAGIFMQMKSARVVSGDCQLRAQVGFEKGCVATPQVHATWYLDLVALDVWKVFLRSWRVGL